jgi:hypothetical protein
LLVTVQGLGVPETSFRIVKKLRAERVTKTTTPNTISFDAVGGRNGITQSTSTANVGANIAEQPSAARTGKWVGSFPARRGILAIVPAKIPAIASAYTRVEISFGYETDAIEYATNGRAITMSQRMKRIVAKRIEELLMKWGYADLEGINSGDLPNVSDHQ